MRRALPAALAVIVVGFTAFDCVAADDPCAAALAQARKTALTQDYDAFDQTPGQGWRRLAEGESCFAEAGTLIDLYLESRSGLRDSQRVNH